MRTLVSSVICLLLAGLGAAPGQAAADPGDPRAGEILAAARDARPGASTALPRHPGPALRLFTVPRIFRWTT